MEHMNLSENLEAAQRMVEAVKPVESPLLTNLHKDTLKRYFNTSDAGFEKNLTSVGQSMKTAVMSTSQSSKFLANSVKYISSNSDQLMGFIEKGVQETEQIKLFNEQEASYSKKKSRQEAAAIKRGQYKNYTVDSDCLQSAIDKYKEQQEKDLTSGKSDYYDRQLTGNELFLPAEKISAETYSKNLSKLLLARDTIKNNVINYQQANPENLSLGDKAYIDFFTKASPIVEDAINTLFLCGGKTESGEPVSAKKRAEAEKHLPLALEKYQFHFANKEVLIGRTMYRELEKSGEIESHIHNKDVIENKELTDVNYFSQIDSAQLETAVSFDKLINKYSDSPQYKKHKKKIDAIYKETMSLYLHSNRVSKYGMYAKYALHDSTNYYRNGETARNEYSDFLDAYVKRQAQQKERIWEYQIDSAFEYIKYLLQGRLTQPVYASYISSKWGEKFEDLDMSQKTYAEVSGNNELLFQKRQEALEEMRKRPDADSQIIRERIAALEGAESWDEIDSLLARYKFDPDYVIKKQIVSEIRESHPEVSAGALELNGFRDFSLAFTDIKTHSVKDMEQLKKNTLALLYFDSTNTYTEDREHPENSGLLRKKEDFIEGDVGEAIKSVFKGIEPQFQEINMYFAELKPMLSKPELAMSYQKDLAYIIKKTQALRDIFGRLADGNDEFFTNIPFEQFEDFVNMRMHTGTMYNVFHMLYSTQITYKNTSVTELTHTDIGMKDFDYEEKLKAYVKPTKDLIDKYKANHPEFADREVRIEKLDFYLDMAKMDSEFKKMNPQPPAE